MSGRVSVFGSLFNTPVSVQNQIFPACLQIKIISRVQHQRAIIVTHSLTFRICIPCNSILQVALLADIAVAGRQIGIIIRVAHGRHLRHVDLGGVDALDQLDGGRTGVGNGDIDPLYRRELIHLLHVVAHFDFHIAGQLVDQQVPGVPQLQGLVPENARVPDLDVQVPDLLQDVVHRVHVFLQVLCQVVLYHLQRVGVAVEVVGQGLGGLPDQGVVVVAAGSVIPVVQHLHKGVEGVLDNAEALLTLTHLVQDVAQLLQALCPGLIGAHTGVHVPVADIQEGVPQLGRAVGQHAVANIQVVTAVIPGVAIGVEGHQVQPLAGISLGVDVGNVVARHVQGGLRGVNAQTCGGERAKCTDNSHSRSPLIFLWAQARKSV